MASAVAAPDPTLSPRDKIRALTSLRFFAAFWVLLFHTLPRVDLPQVAGRIVDLGYSAVSLFFVLSGFILAKVYRGLRGRPGIVRFLVARFARIYPMYLLTLAMDVPRLLIFRIAKFGLAAAVATTGATFLFQAALLQAWVPRLGALNFPSWSISTEAFFYLMFPLILPLAERVRRLPTRLVWMAALLLLNLAVALALPHDTDWKGDADFWRNPLLRLPEFAFGALLAPLAAIGGPNRASHFPLTVYALGIAAMAGLLAILFWAPAINDARLIEVALTPVFAILIVLMATTENAMMRIVSGRTLVVLGEASYALYLLHAPVAALFLMGGIVFAHWASIGYAAYVAVTVGASIVAHLLVEKPARTWIVDRWQGIARGHPGWLYPAAGRKGAQ